MRERLVTLSITTSKFDNIDFQSHVCPLGAASLVLTGMRPYGCEALVSAGLLQLVLAAQACEGLEACS